MRTDDTEPTDDALEQDTGRAYASAAARRARRPKQQIAIGAVGVLAVLGVGVAIVASQTHKPTAETAPDVVALPPPSSPASAAPSSSVAPASSAAASSAAVSSAVVSPSGAAPAATSAEPTGGAKASAQAAGPPRPARTLRAVPQNSTVKDSDVDVDETFSDDKRKRLKVAAARADLTGYRELSWITEDRERVGDVECTNRIRLSPDLPARERPTLLLCWRISATRSVYTVAVDMDGKPVRKESVAAVEARWNELG
ncbi:hypothetical protein ACIA8K_12070 [Catenuloplanes sp. NPDC051500]|uniref:hypothetical protein n=1 Tax=Catenuloplanes sp. NPDC051500 TaxID=3363959 RepID=UPI00379DDF11